MKEEKEKLFNRIEEKILRVLYQQQLALSIYSIAKECDISYPTAKHYVHKLEREGFLNKEFSLYSQSNTERARYSFNFKTLQEGPV